MSTGAEAPRLQVGDAVNLEAGVASGACWSWAPEHACLRGEPVCVVSFRTPLLEQGWGLSGCHTPHSLSLRPSTSPVCQGLRLVALAASPLERPIGGPGSQGTFLLWASGPPT